MQATEIGCLTTGFMTQYGMRHVTVGQGANEKIVMEELDNRKSRSG